LRIEKTVEQRTRKKIRKGDGAVDVESGSFQAEQARRKQRD
jgi:hypothetical protein